MDRQLFCTEHTLPVTIAFDVYGHLIDKTGIVSVLREPL